MDPSDIQSIKLEGHGVSVRSATFSPDGQLIASGSDDKTVRLWNSKSGEEVATLESHTRRVWSVAFSPDGSILASGSNDKAIKLWNVASRREFATIVEDSYVTSVTFSPDGALLASASARYTARLWDVKSRASIKVLKEDYSSTLRPVAFSSDGKTIASVSKDHHVWLWNVASGACIATLQGHTRSVYHLVFSPVGVQLASSSGDCTIILWDTASKNLIETLRGHSHEVNSATFSPDGKFLASGSDDKTIRLWNVALRSHHSSLKGHSGEVSCVAFSPNGSQLVSASYDCSIRLWSLPDQSITHSNYTLLPPSQGISNDQDDEIQSPHSPVDLKNDITGLISLADSVHIGIGGFGDVFSGSHKDRGKVALKRPQRLFDDAFARRFLREVDLWCSVSHRYILPCLGMCKFDPYIYVVSPFIENGDLRSCMTKGVSFNRSKILYEVAEALAHLHHLGIVHGDVKAQNVLLSNDGSALLCDFGLAKILDSTVTSTESKGAGSVRWMAPELFKNASRSMASDVYSLGITIAEVLSGQAPYPDIMDNWAVMYYVMVDGGRPQKTPLLSPEGKSYSVLWKVSEKCWTKEAGDRLYMVQVLAMLFPLTREKN